MRNYVGMYVIFIDLLGFATAVEGLTPDEHDKLASVIRAADSNAEDDWSGPRLPRAPARLYRTYVGFQKALRQGLEDVHAMAGVSRETVTSTIFSDSAFVMFESTELLVHFAWNFMSRIYHKCIPVRGGIGSGSFSHFSLSLVSHPGGHLDAHCPFLGSGVVRAYRAESCGLKGARIFVHSSAARDLSAILIPLPEDEIKADVAHELNLLRSGWSGNELNTARQSLIFLELMGRDVPDKHREHYVRSAAAVGRMYTAITGLMIEQQNR
jgi:hypothetical protein